MIDKTDPTNRDTVPAMLTPGEFVLNKEASTMFAPVIEQMNDAGLQHRAMKNMGGGIQNYNKGGFAWHKNYTSEVEAAIVLAAAKYGIDPLTLKTIVYLESRGNPEAQSKQSSAGGIMQFIDDTAKSYNLENRFDVNESLDAGSKLLTNNASHLRSVLGREPTPAEIYLAHQQGATGALRLLKDPSINVLDVENMTESKVIKNGGNVNMTAGEFSNMWLKKANDAANFIGGDDTNTPTQPTTQATSTEPVPRFFSGGGKDGEGSFGMIGDFFGGVTTPSVAPMVSIPPQMRPKDLAPQMVAGITDSMSSSRPQMRPNTQVDPLAVEQAVMQASVPQVQAAPPVPTSFNEAFRDARADMGAGGIFNFRGNNYTTDYAEEKDMVTANMGGVVYLNDGSSESSLMPDVNSDESLLQGSSGSVDRASRMSTQEIMSMYPVPEVQGIPTELPPAPRPTMLGGQLYYLNGDGFVTDTNGNPVQDPEIGAAVQDKLNYSEKESAANAQAYNESIAQQDVLNGTNLQSVNPSYDSMRQQQESNATEAEKIRAEIAQIDMERQAANDEFNKKQSEVVPPLERGQSVFVEGFVPPIANSGKGGGPDAPTFMNDVVPYLGRVAGSLASNVGNTVNEFMASPTLPVGSVDVNKEYRDIKSIIAGGVDRNGVPLTDNQIKAYNLRIKAIEKERDYNDRMEPFGAGEVFDTVIESGNQLAAGVNDYITDKVGGVVSGFNPEAGANILDSKLGYAPPPRRELTPDEIEFNRLRKLTGDVTFKPENKIPEVEAAIANLEKTPEVTTTTPDQDNATRKASAEIDPKGGDGITPEVKGAMSTIKSVFGDLFDTKELMRAAIMYLGGRATGLSGNQALAFAGKTYLAREEAKGARTQKFVDKLISDGKHKMGSIAAYRKSLDPNDLKLIGLTLAETGNTGTYYASNAAGSFVALQLKEMKGSDDSVYLQDSNGKVYDPAQLHQDPKRVKGTPEFDTALASQISLYKDTFDELRLQGGIVTNKMDGKPAVYKTDLKPSVVAADTAAWALRYGVPLQMVPGLMTEAYNLAIGGKDINGNPKRAQKIEPYLNQLWITQSAGDPNNFKIGNDDKVKFVETSTVSSWVSNIHNQMKKVNPQFNEVTPIRFSTWLRQTDISGKWSLPEEQGGLSQEARNAITKRGNAVGKSGYMQYILEEAAKNYEKTLTNPTT